MILRLHCTGLTSTGRRRYTDTISSATAIIYIYIYRRYRCFVSAQNGVWFTIEQPSSRSRYSEHILLLLLRPRPIVIISRDGT